MYKGSGFFISSSHLLFSIIFYNSHPSESEVFFNQIIYLDMGPVKKNICPMLHILYEQLKTS